MSVKRDAPTTDLPRPLPAAAHPPHVLADLAALACALAARALGWAISTIILALDVVATAAIAAGHNAGLALARVSQDLAGLPLVGATLQGDRAYASVGSQGDKACNTAGPLLSAT